jgi:hypothetical protein
VEAVHKLDKPIRNHLECIDLPFGDGRLGLTGVTPELVGEFSDLQLILHHKVFDVDSTRIHQPWRYQ